MAKQNAAFAAGDYATVMNLIEPVTRRQLEAAKLWGADLTISISEINAEANAGIASQEPYFTAEERAEAAREGEEAAKQGAEFRQRLTDLLNGFGIKLDLAYAMSAKDIPIGEPLETLVRGVDQGKLIAALDELNNGEPTLPRPEIQTPPEVTDYRIEGDRATARSGDRVLEFARIDDRWYSVPPPIPKVVEPKGLPCPSVCH